MNGNDLASALTKREHLIAMAMQGLLSNATFQMGTPHEVVAQMAIEYADGVLAALQE